MRYRGMFFAALVAIAALGAACRADDRQTVWRFAIEETQGSVQHAYAVEFERLIEEASGGEVDVKVYTYGTLGTSDQITELLYDSSIQFAMASPGHLGKLIPEVQVFLLHYVFSADDAIDNEALANPDLRRTLDELYSRKNFKLLSLYTEGQQVWTTKSAIRQPSDFEGVKMRVMTSPLLMAAYEAYGASPTPLPYSEVYSALQLNMIDGQVNPVFAIEEMSFYEVTSYMIFPGHAQFVTSAMTNEPWFDELPPERKQWILDAIDELQDYILEVQKEYNRERLELIEKEEPSLAIVRLTEEERAAFEEKSLPVRDLFVSDTGESGRRVLDQLLAAVREAEAAADSAD